VSAERRTENFPKPATARVFFALWPTADVADRLGDIAQDAALSFGGRATRRETIHLTLAFLGNVAESRLTELSSAAHEVCVAPFGLDIDQLGYWSHNHLLWAGCRTQLAPLNELFGQLCTVLARAGFRIGGEARDFAPHVTLVRRIPDVAAPSENFPLPSIQPIHWHCERFVLIGSTLSASGPVYRVIDEFQLRATKFP